MSEAAARARRMPALEAARDVGVGTIRKIEGADAASASLAAALRALPIISDDVEPTELSNQAVQLGSTVE